MQHERVSLECIFGTAAVVLDVLNRFQASLRFIESVIKDASDGVHGLSATETLGVAALCGILGDTADSLVDDGMHVMAIMKNYNFQ